MLNALLTSVTENLSVLVVLLVWFIWQQSTRHKDLTSLRKEISDSNASLRKEISDFKDGLNKKMENIKDGLNKKIDDVKDELNKKIEDKVNDATDELRKDIAKQGEGIAKIEGLLMGLAPYDTVAEPPPVGYGLQDKDGNE